MAWTSGFYKIRGASLLDEELSAFQEKFCSIDLLQFKVMDKFPNDFWQPI
jgi:hypothetical protein